MNRTFFGFGICSLNVAFHVRTNFIAPLLPLTILPSLASIACTTFEITGGVTL